MQRCNCFPASNESESQWGLHTTAGSCMCEALHKYVWLSTLHCKRLVWAAPRETNQTWLKSRTSSETVFYKLLMNLSLISMDWLNTNSPKHKQLKLVAKECFEHLPCNLQLVLSPKERDWHVPPHDEPPPMEWRNSQGCEIGDIPLPSPWWFDGHAFW